MYAKWIHIDFNRSGSADIKESLQPENDQKLARMRSVVQFHFVKLLLLAFAFLSSIARASPWCLPDPGDNVESECPGSADHFTLPGIPVGCPERRFCYRRVNQSCVPTHEESQCERGLDCVCGRCMGCDKNLICSDDFFCPNPYYAKKRQPSRPSNRRPIHLPWFPPRWMDVIDNYQPTYS